MADFFNGAFRRGKTYFAGLVHQLASGGLAGSESTRGRRGENVTLTKNQVLDSQKKERNVAATLPASCAKCLLSLSLWLAGDVGS
jgi:hypothetical protein